MANVDRVNGLIPVQHISGGPWSGQTMKMYHAAGTTVTHDLFPGDPVIMSSSGDADGIPSVVKATLASGNDTCGVIVSIDPDADNLSRTWIDGASAGYINVCTDPATIYEVQANEALAVTDIGQNCILIQTSAGSRTTGASGIELDASEVSSTAGDMCKILGFVQRADNSVAADVKVLVKLNNHQFADQHAGV